MLGGASHETEVPFQRRRRDQGVGQADSGLAEDSPGSLSDCSVDRDLPKGSKHATRQIRPRSAGEEFGTGDHRVVEPVTTDLELRGAP